MAKKKPATKAKTTKKTAAGNNIRGKAVLSSVSSEYAGKTVDRIEIWEHGTYRYTGYIVRFTDGTLLRFRGNSNADIEIYTEE